MDATVRARFFHASAEPREVRDFPELLLLEMKKTLSERERDVSPQLSESDAKPGVTLRVENCEPDGEFIEGQFCRKQIANIPPQAGCLMAKELGICRRSDIIVRRVFCFCKTTFYALLRIGFQST
jgi:hypothetical protein